MAPLAAGTVAASRVSVAPIASAPAMPTIHAATPVQPNEANAEGTRKMPEPIMPPTTSAVAVQKPNGRAGSRIFA